MADSVNSVSNGDSNNNESEFVMKIDSDMFDNLTTSDLIRGDAPKDIEKRCLELCAVYIGGSWAKATTTDVKVCRITGGLTNQLWHVQLNDGFDRVPNEVYLDEPSEVAIKLYQEKHMKNYHEDDSERLNDILILTVMAEAKLGPTIYGVFADGFIQSFHKHEQFRAKHQQDSKMLDELVGLLAKIHNLKVPIRKTKNILLDDIGKMIHSSYANFGVQKICEEAQYKHLLERDLMQEWAILQRIIAKLNAPLVFCHCDFRGSNLLVTDNGLLCVDLEYSNYGCRPYDMSTFLNEWGKSEMFDRSMGKIPNDDVIKSFVASYIAHSDKLSPGYANKPENQPDVLYREVRVFFLVIYMFFMGIIMKTEDSIIPNIPFDRKQFIGNCDQIYGFYKLIKKELVDQGLIDKEDL